MAERRMFAKAITSQYRFLTLSKNARLLYYDLGMEADDDGVVESFMVIRMTGASKENLYELEENGFIDFIDEENLVAYIVDWHTNNQIRKDRYVKGKYYESLVDLGYGEKTDQHSSNSCVVKAGKTEREIAYSESSLPCSFEYKVRNAFYGKKCPLCGNTMERTRTSNSHIPTIQHNLPISKGGKHELGNISVICKRCNVSIRDNKTGKLNADEVELAWKYICDNNL